MSKEQFRKDFEEWWWKSSQDDPLFLGNGSRMSVAWKAFVAGAAAQLKELRDRGELPTIQINEAKALEYGRKRARTDEETRAQLLTEIDRDGKPKPTTTPSPPGPCLIGKFAPKDDGDKSARPKGFEEDDPADPDHEIGGES